MSDIPFTLDQLKILQTISLEGSFRKAAEKLYISQPAVSLQIQSLEKQLNVPIFYRDKRKARLTETGQLLLNYCERILSLCEETCRALDELQTLQSGVLTIGASQTTGTYLMPRLIGIFRHKYPQISIELQVHSTRQISWGVANGQIDLAVVGGELPTELNDSLDITSYAEDELALILPRSHPFSSLDSIGKEDKVLIIDDLIATGGTAEAAAKLIEISGGNVACFVFVINLFDLNGSDNLIKKGYKVENLIEFPGH